MTLTERLREYVAACTTGLWIESHEHEDAIAEIARMCRDEDWKLATWDIASGLSVSGGPSDQGGSDPLAAVASVNGLVSDDGTAILVLRNFHRFLQL